MITFKYFFGNVYMSALLGIAAILLILKILQCRFDGPSPLLLFLIVIAAAAWSGGLKAGLFTTFLSVATSTYFLVEPINSIYIAESSERLRVFLLASVGVVCCIGIARLYKKEKRALHTVLEREKQLKREIDTRIRTQEEWNLYASLAKSSTEFISMCDTQGVPFFINDAGLKLVGLDNLEQGLKAPVREFFFPEDQAFIMDVFFPAILEKGRGEIEIRFRHFKTEEALWMIYNVFALKDLNDKVVGLGTVSTDITLRKQAEEALRESQMDLNRAQAVAHIGSWRLDVRKNRLDWSDENFRIFGVPIGTSLTYESFLEIVHPADRAFVDTAWKAALKGKPYDIEHRLMVGRKVKWVRELAELEFDENGLLRGGFGTTEDITDIKIIQEALQHERTFLRQVIDTTPSMIFVKDKEGKFLLANEALARVYGTSPKHLIGFTDDHFNPQGDEVSHFRQNDLEVFNTGRPKFIQEEKVTNSDGSVHWFSTVKIPLFDGDQCTKLLGVATDITDRKQAKEALVRVNTELERRVQERTTELQLRKEQLMVSLQQKEVLLKEIHHRVKNNLQIISSLLQLQSDVQTDSRVRELFMDSRRRIRSMALIHEQLYKGSDLKTINFSDYAAQLVNSIHRSFTSTISPVTVRLEILAFPLDIDYALPLGLIISELVSNSFKHAFPNEGDNSQPREIWVKMAQEPADCLTLEVGDSGRGLPEGINIEQSPSMGLQLVRSFVLQLKGRITVQSHPGARFSIIIPAEKIFPG